jgi:hypothetical protein
MSYSQAATFSDAMSESLSEAEKEYKAGEAEVRIPSCRQVPVHVQAPPHVHTDMVFCHRVQAEPVKPKASKALDAEMDKPVEKAVPKKKVDLSGE